MIKLEEIGDSFIIEQINGKIRLSIIGLESAARLKREWVNFTKFQQGMEKFSKGLLESRGDTASMRRLEKREK